MSVVGLVLGSLVHNKSIETIMFSRLRSKLSRVLSRDKEEGTVYQEVNNDEKEIQSNRNNETKKNTQQSPKNRDTYVNSPERTRCFLNLMRHNVNNDEKEIQSNRNNETKKNTQQSPKNRDTYVNSPERTRCFLNLMRHNVNNDEKEIQSNRNNETKKNTQQSPKNRDTYVNSPERTRCLLNLLRHDPRNDNLPPYSSTKTSCPSSGLPSQQKPTIKGKEIKNDRPPPYDLPENMSSASRCQYIRGLIERRKAEIQTLEQQLEEETEKARPSSTGTTLRVGESSSMHVTLQIEAAQEETGKEGIPSTYLSSQTRGTTQDMDDYIVRHMKRLQELENMRNLLIKERERSTLQHDLSVGGDTLIYWCGQRK
ncbi:hypothetical protein BTUL_0050g00520 [Botrytis tulipae]|uniref:Uncharacterized protein n=1 Tax=Botrytis tulipae TaxID=87230 RepID=A0A4Z1F0S1_9HELO|nr:hypothetical protein BTUL_0050g00520 [Botrytis tulipae]